MVASTISLPKAVLHLLHKSLRPQLPTHHPGSQLPPPKKKKERKKKQRPSILSACLIVELSILLKNECLDRHPNAWLKPYMMYRLERTTMSRKRVHTEPPSHPPKRELLDRYGRVQERGSG